VVEVPDVAILQEPAQAEYSGKILAGVPRIVADMWEREHVDELLRPTHRENVDL